MQNDTIAVSRNQDLKFKVWKQLTKADMIILDAIKHLGEYCLQSEIMALVDLSRRQVSLSIKRLEDFGLLKVDRSSNRNVYFFGDDGATNEKHACALEPSNTLTTTKYKSGRKAVSFNLGPRPAEFTVFRHSSSLDPTGPRPYPSRITSLFRRCRGNQRKFSFVACGG